MMGLVWSLLGVLAGTFIALQAPINAGLSRSMGFPVAAAAASFVAGTLVLIALAFLMSRMHDAPIDWNGPPVWMFFAGGCLGAAYVVSIIILTPKLGTAATMAFVVAGQLLAGLALDKIGAFGLVARELSMGRVAGAILLFAGALLIRLT